MSNIDQLKSIFDKAIADDPATWDQPVAQDPGAPLRKDALKAIFSSEDSEMIEFMINQRVSDGENIEDIAQEFMTEMLTFN